MEHYTLEQLNNLMNGGATDFKFESGSLVDFKKIFEVIKQGSSNIGKLFLNNQKFMNTLIDSPCKTELNKLIESFIKLPLVGVNSLKLFDIVEKKIKIREDTDTVKLIFCIIRKLLPTTKNYKNSQIIQMFEINELPKTIFEIFGSLFSNLCNIESKLEVKKTNPQKGGEPVMIGVVAIVAILCILIIVITLTLGIAVTITGVVGFIGFVILVVTFIQLLPMLFVISKTKDEKALTDISLSYLKKYDFKSANSSIINLTDKLPQLFESFKHAADVSNIAIGATSKLAPSSNVISQKGGVICESLDKLMKLKSSELSIENIKKTIIDKLDTENMMKNDIMTTMTRNVFIVFYLIEKNYDKITQPIKTGNIKLFSPLEIKVMFDDAIKEYNNKSKILEPESIKQIKPITTSNIKSGGLYTIKKYKLKKI